eukprot:4586671-Prymnesium_polylepis.1
MLPYGVVQNEHGFYEVPEPEYSGPVPAPRHDDFDEVVFVVSLDGFKRKITIPRKAFSKSLNVAVISRFLDAYAKQASAPKSAPFTITLDDIRVSDTNQPVSRFVNATMRQLVITPAEVEHKEPGPAVFFVRCEEVELKLSVQQRRLADAFGAVVVSPFLRAFNRKRPQAVPLEAVARAEVSGLAIDLAAPVASVASLDGSAVHVTLYEHYEADIETVREEDATEASAPAEAAAPPAPAPAEEPARAEKTKKSRPPSVREGTVDYSKWDDVDDEDDR